VRVALPAEEIFVDGDVVRLEQVVVNLLSNACKFTNPRGQVLLSVETAGGEAVVRVRDSGIGIAPEVLPRVFDLFAQAARGLDRAQGGLGIGLTVAQRIVELHGGCIEAFSEGLGTGAEFVVRLPVLDPSKFRPAVAPSKEEEKKKASRVLVVEDNPDVAEGFRLLLEVLGHQVLVASTGFDGLDAARASRPEVMLVDIGLPGMNGYEVARQVRSDPSLRGVTLVAVTGYGRDEDKRAALAAGFDAHLVKPVDLHKLNEAIRSRRRDHGGLPTAPPDA
jgi:CheY-like chemotaxis protein